MTTDEQITALQTTIADLSHRLEKLEAKENHKAMPRLISNQKDVEKILAEFISGLLKEYDDMVLYLPIQWITAKINATLKYNINPTDFRTALKTKNMKAENRAPQIPIGKKPDQFNPSDQITVFDRKRANGRPYAFHRHEWIK